MNNIFFDEEEMINKIVDKLITNSRFIEKYYNLWDILDRDNNGAITKEEYSNVLLSLGSNTDFIDENFFNIDKDGNNMITIDEYLKMNATKYAKEYICELNKFTNDFFKKKF